MLTNKNKILLVILTVLLIILTAAGIKLYNQNVLTQTNDTITQEAGQELVLNASDFFDADETKASKITFDTSAVDLDTTGEYTAIAYFKNKRFEINVIVEDTTPPAAEFSNRCIFTNDIANANLTDSLSGVYDASEWTAKLIRFESKGTLQVMDETAQKVLTDSIPLPCDPEELKQIGTTDLPTEEGIYRAVMELSDVHGNTSFEEVYVIYDTTGAKIEDVPDKTISVSEEDLEKEPEINKSDYTITDNVDGAIDSENIQCELELRNEKNHEWLVQVSYTDRAGNDSRAEFLIMVKKESDSSADAKETSNTGTDSTSQNGETASANNTDSGNYDPADTDKDGVVTPEEAAATISPTEQMVIDAGYGNVLQLPSGNYAVLTHGDGYVNGKHGFDILDEYLASIGLESSQAGGCWIDSDNDWYWFIAENVHPIDTSGLEWTGDGEIEFID